MNHLNRVAHHRVALMQSANNEMMSALVDAFRNISVILMLNVVQSVSQIRSAHQIALA